MRYEIKSIPLWPVIRVGFFVNLIVGLIMGVLWAMFMAPIMSALMSIPAMETGQFEFPTAPLGVMMVMMPIFSAIWSAVFGTFFLALLVLVHNLVVKLVGGIELNLEPLPATTAQATPTTPIEARTAPASFGPPPPPPPVGHKETPPPSQPEPPVQPPPAPPVEPGSSWGQNDQADKPDKDRNEDRTNTL